MINILKEAFSESKGLPKFKPVLDGWLEVQRTFITEMRDDFPWHYHERASIGFLAAGAWRSGPHQTVALEEWHTDKGTQPKPSKGLVRPLHLQSRIEASTPNRSEIHAFARHWKA